MSRRSRVSRLFNECAVGVVGFSVADDEELAIDEAGNISLNFTTYNGTTVTATAKYDFLPVATGGVDGVGVQEFRSSGVQKVLRNGQLLIHKRGECYNILGYKVSE